LEEPFSAVSAANPLLWRDGNLSDSLLAVNGNFEFSSTFSLPAFSAAPQFASRLVAGRGNYQTLDDQQALF